MQRLELYIIYIGLHLQKRSGGCLHSILSHHNNFKIMYIIWSWLIYCTKIMKNRSSFLHIFLATYHLALTSHDWRNPCWRLRFWPAWTLASGMRQDSQDSYHDTKTIASTYYILHISFIHSAPTGSIVGTHVRHTPVGSPGQHEVLFTVETPEFDAADPVDPLAFQNGVLTGQPQTILETSS